MPAAKRSPIVFPVEGPITRGDIPQLCAALRTLLEAGGVETVDCAVGKSVRPDAVTVDALARLQLTAKRPGCRLRLRHASSELRELIALMGLRGPMRSERRAV